jgi:hypothetical protein
VVKLNFEGVKIDGRALCLYVQFIEKLLNYHGGVKNVGNGARRAKIDGMKKSFGDT